MNSEHWRSSMGRGLGPWAHLPGALHEVTDSSWSMLSGAPSADVNFVVAWDPDAVTRVMADVTARDLPAMVFLAGAAKQAAGTVPSGWTHVGDLPAMLISLADAIAEPDPRVRAGGADDQRAVTDLISEAFGIPTEVAAINTAVLAGPSDAMRVLVLEDGGELVSTVITTYAEDTVSLWCMATPERNARRGYGRALLAAALAEARERGATTGLLGATPAGQPLYESTGWKTFETWDIYLNADSAQFH